MAGVAIMWGRSSGMEGITPTTVVRAASKEELEHEPDREVWRDPAYKSVFLKTATGRNEGRGQTHY